MTGLSPPLRIALTYAFFGILWILFSDNVLSFLVKDIETLVLIQTFKGALYVLITTILLYFLIRRDYQKLLAKETEKNKIFQATIRVVHHILNNFLNNMTLFKLEAENCDEFDKQVLGLYDEVISSAQTQLQTLSSVHDLTEEKIKNTVFYQ
ncbi:MAG: hypothetical protein RIT27_1162 [Pseudomonadota bacterium]|jgi:hypothetical protein